MKCVAAVVAVLTGSLCGGCGVQQAVLGGDCLVMAMDELTTPGEVTVVRVQVRSGDFLEGRPGLAVQFYRNGRLFKVTETGDDGLATITFAPDNAGDHILSVRLVPAGIASQVPPPTELLVACRPADTDIAVVDLDKTIVASGFEAVLLGSPEPMARSQEVLARLAKTRTIVYMTHRPELLGPKSKAWMIDHGFPAGPLLLSDTEGFLRGSETYKTGRLAALGKTFTNIHLGIGDKLSDARAYLDNGMTAVLIPDIPQPGVNGQPRRLRALARRLRQFADDENIHVVRGWDEVAEAVFSKKKHPPSAMRHRLIEMAGNGDR